MYFNSSALVVELSLAKEIAAKRDEWRDKYMFQAAQLDTVTQERDALAETLTSPLNTAQHSDDIAVDKFAAEMKAKLAACRAKGLAGWSNPGDPTDTQLARLLTQNMTKGNAGTFVDVANFCMFLHQRGADPVTLASAAFYAPATNYQRNTLLAAMQEVREALQLANDSPGGIITDTIWMPHRPETLLDFIDATITPLLPESKAENGNLASTYSLQPLGGEELVEVMEERAQAVEHLKAED
jgi:hypothetical protein